MTLRASPARQERRIAALRRGTENLIALEPTLIQLRRPAVPVSDGAGGRTKAVSAPVIRTAQYRFFGTFSGQSYQNREGRTDHGVTESNNERVLIGPYDDDIQEGDSFVLDNVTWVVEELDDDRRYQTKAICRRG